MRCQFNCSDYINILVAPIKPLTRFTGNSRDLPGTQVQAPDPEELGISSLILPSWPLYKPLGGLKTLGKQTEAIASGKPDVLSKTVMISHKLQLLFSNHKINQICTVQKLSGCIPNWYSRWGYTPTFQSLALTTLSDTFTITSWERVQKRQHLTLENRRNYQSRKKKTT